MGKVNLRGAGGRSSWATKYSRGSALHRPDASRSLLSLVGGLSRLSVRRLGLAGGSVGRRRGSLKDSILPVILTSLGGGIGAVLLGTPWRPPTVFAPRGRILALPSLVETELLADGATGWSKNLVPPPPESLLLLVSVRYVALEPVTSCGQYCVDYNNGGPFHFERGWT